MKIGCTRSDLIGAIQIVSKAVASKPQTPIMSGIYMKAENGTLELQANNHDTGLKITMEVDVIEAGTIVLPGRYLQEVVRKLPGEKVVITLIKEKGIVELESKPAKFMLRVMNVDDWPQVNELEDGTEFTVKDSVLKEMIRKTSFACSNDDTRPVFTGCYLTTKDSTMVMVGTNTHRLSVKNTTLDEPVPETKAIIPAKILNDLLSFLADDMPTDIRISCTKNQIGFWYENIYLISRVIEGNYPEYQRAIPSSFKTTVHLDANELRAATDRVSLIARSDDYNIMRCEFYDNKLRISSTNIEIGEAEEIIGCDMEGPEVDISFNSNYIIDALKIMDSEKLKLCLNEPLTPMGVYEDGNDGFTYIVTPVRTAR